MAPKVSVIIPVYNEEKYLKECVDSVLNQTLTDLEIIIVDDGSTDTSVQMMDVYEQSDSRIKVIHKPNSGYGNSMNRGLAVATGQYIGIVESDDSIIPKMYERLFSMTENETVDVVKGNFWDCYDEKDGSITKVINDERRDMPDVKESFSIDEYPQLLWGHPSIWTSIYRRQFLLDNDIKFKEEKGGGWVDNPFFFDTLFCAKKIRWTRQPLYQYRKTNSESSSVGYNLRIPFDRMIDNLEVAEKDKYTDEETRKFMYARALMYLVGATNEKHFAYNVDYAKPFMRKMLLKMESDIISDDFNLNDQRNFWKYRSPLSEILPKTKKVLIYNWIPFDNPQHIGGGVTIYCKNLIASILKYRPDVQVYFISSGWAYDVTTTKCYFRSIENIFGDRCRSFEIVNSPVPAAQDMLFYNPTFAFENEELKAVFSDFIEKNGPFDSVHFNNIEGISLDILSLKEVYSNTRFVYSMHNYVPICMTGFYYRRDLHCNCVPGHNAEDCDRCINREDGRRLRKEMIQRATFNVANPEQYDEDRWSLKFGFEKLEMLQDKSYMEEFIQRATASINKYMDVVLAVSERVHTIAVENGINPELVKTSYIGTKVANYQIQRSNASPEKPFKIVFLGSNVGYEEKGYPFLLKALQKLDGKHASRVELVLTTTSRDQDAKIHLHTKKFRSVKIIHGYSHHELHSILSGCHLGVIPVLWEDNLPQIAIEMVALGVPILRSDAGGASELCNSEKFKFKAGNTDDFLEKLSWFIDHPEEVSEFWLHHQGLVTLKDHLEEMEAYLGLGKLSEDHITISLEDYMDMVEENEFLYKHLSDGSGIGGITQAEMNWKDSQIRQLQEQVEGYISPDALREQYNTELQKVIEQRDYLQYVIDETRKSKTYKIGRAITALPRAMRGN